MSDLRDLYQETILEHNRHPRNRGVLESATAKAEGYNPLCGDMVLLTLHEKDGVIDEIAFDGQGCAISTASASMMTEAVKGKTLDEAAALFREFQAMVTGSAEASSESLGDLDVFEGVRDYPVRIKCAVLPWHALQAALAGTSQVSTE